MPVTTSPSETIRNVDGTIAEYNLNHFGSPTRGEPDQSMFSQVADASRAE